MAPGIPSEVPGRKEYMIVGDIATQGTVVLVILFILILAFGGNHIDPDK